MGQISDYLYIKISKDRMLAEIFCTDAYKELNRKIETQEIERLLKANQIVFGINYQTLELVTTHIDADQFPLIIAEGIKPVTGEDGQVSFTFDVNTKVDRKDKSDFREVMRIPSIKENQKIATITMATDGETGTNILGQVIQARPGRQAPIRAGKQVVYKDDTKSFYAEAGGQVNIRGNFIDVVSVYEVHGDLSMKVGNLDFVGSITIHGDIPTGFTVKAEGDVKVFGLVEAASIMAGGSVYVSEGLSGLEKGNITAKQDVHIGYVNQGIIESGQSIYVENSILHSECVAKESIICHRGNIIGGSISAGKKIEAKDVGNRLNTKTLITLGEDGAVAEEISVLEEKLKVLNVTLTKLDLIGKKLTETLTKDDIKGRVTLLRQKRSAEQTEEQINSIKEELAGKQAYLGSEDEAVLIVRNFLYPNTNIAFGKYEKLTDKTNQYIKVFLIDNEISIQAL